MSAPIQNRADVDFKQLDKDADLSKVIEYYNKLAKGINFFNKFISIQSNFDGYIAKDVKIPASSSVQIQHFLGVIPKWRIILRQVGNGVITDIPSEWTTQVVSLKNNGAEEVTLSVFIARE